MNPRRTEKIVFFFLLLSTLVVVLPVILVVGIIVVRGSSVLSWEFLTALPRMGMKAGGIFPAIFGTFCLVVGTVVFALPVGIFSAIYLSEYSKRGRLTRLIELAIVNLAGVPSVVYGLFGLGFFVVFLNFGASILAGSLTLAVMSLPVIITASREALQAVPKSFREVSYSLGATKWQTIRHAVLPHALPGILTGTILSLSRAAGETAPILFTVAAFYLPKLPKSVFDQAMALPYHLYVLSTQVPNVKLELQYGTALVLVALAVLMNIVGIVIRSYFRTKKQW
ncbi:MAG: phosphate ABC transporter, permease protein PstA [Omnitrophica bacterium RIFCSPLOWO2_12_FULL_50_11]|nr:MAG: phosphate ABC transporter, permease protein PstA [Omnitrophica bacterium RIFCSPLOWO2_12_FULL_50_11]